MKRILQILFGLAVVAGLAMIAFIYFGTPHKCYTKAKVCITYSNVWKKADSKDPVVVRLTKTKPGMTFQVSMTNTKITGSVASLAGALDKQLAKDVPGYKLVDSNAIVVSKILGAQLVYDFTPKGATSQVRTTLIVLPLKDKTYYITSQTAKTDVDKTKAELDRMIKHVEIRV